MKRPSQNRKSPRKTDYDYTLSGAYFVTICTHDRQSIFGDVVDTAMHLSEIGQIAAGCWIVTPYHFDDVEVDCFVVMPNHVHAIIIIYDQNNNVTKDTNTNSSKDTNEINDVRNRHACSLPTQTTESTNACSLPQNETEPTRGIFKNGRYIPPGAKSRSLGAIVGSYKSAVTRITRQTIEKPPPIIWQRFYHDRIIRNEKELNMIRQYVHTNPARWHMDRFNE